MKSNAPKDIDDYITGFPGDIQDKLQKIRAVIRKAVPGAQEVMSYQMPAFKQNGILIYFAAFSDHVSIFPTSSGVAKFKKELKEYETTKGTIKIPLHKPIPYGLISRITKFRFRESSQKGKKK
ncbi:MAG TPA: DUF1801 domain-containing protein [Chitinivibrionales bacterium]|nr:DUF1801 domain-containing protein [Chitinivibrionales bacterium]